MHSIRISRFLAFFVVACSFAFAQQHREPATVLVINTELDSVPVNGSAVRLMEQVRAVVPATWTVTGRHFRAVDTAMLRREHIDFILLSGQGTPWKNYPVHYFTEFRPFLEHAGVPVLGVCGGHQLIGLAYGEQVAPMWGEIRDSSYEGLEKQHGFVAVKRVSTSPLLKGLRRSMKVWENHYEEIKRTPKDFVVIATEKHCRIQAMQHRTLPIFGVQFHPEKMDPHYPAGERILRNFFRLNEYVRAR